VRVTLLAAAISPDNTPHGYNLTFAFPMLMFIIIAGTLFLRFRSSHRVPGHVALASSRWATAAAAPAPAAAQENTTNGSTLGRPAPHEGEGQEGEGQEGPVEESTEGTE
jgi:hypothetical protein